MRGASSVEAYLVHPVGSYLWGPTYVVWWSSVVLNGIMFWGKPDERDVQRITRALEGELQVGVRPHASLIDARHLTAVDLGAFNTLSKYVRSRREPFARVVEKQALLRPDGLAGAAVAGFYAVLTPSYPVGVFTDLADALGWLDREEEAATVAELSDIHLEAIGGSASVVALRSYLDESPGGVTLKSAAHTLGVSPRNLQRKLSEAQTSFQVEQNAAQLRLAKNLLLETEYDIKRIALDAGCASSQHFCALFRRLTGESPSEWRARQRSLEGHSNQNSVGKV